MRKLCLLFLFLGFIGLVKGQVTWTFNNNTLNGWTASDFTVTYNSTNVVLTTRGVNNPEIINNSAGVDASLYKYGIITLKVGASGPTQLRLRTGTTTIQDRTITNSNSDFITYVINLSAASSWTGTLNNLRLMFRNSNGTTYNSSGSTIQIESISFVSNPYSGLTSLYVDPTNGDDQNRGTSASPLKTIPFAISTAAAYSIPTVYIKSGTYQYSSSVSITTAAASPILVTPEPGGAVTFQLSSANGFILESGAKNIEFKGFEFDGNSDALDHWTLLSQYLWQPDNLSNALRGGGTAILVRSAQDIKITDNYIHDFYQKAVNIEDGRYVTVKGNIINNIALTSLSGGHGIMRQQGSGSFADADDVNKYRWDLDGNMILNVVQRIYSWVPSKGYLNMTLDEGKPILIDETPNHDVNMKAKISNNVVAFNKIDAIRLKYTNNLTVSNNSVYSTDIHADGITDVATGILPAQGTPFLNFVASNNAVFVASGAQAFELNDANGSTGPTFSNNYAGQGIINPAGVASSFANPMFQNPTAGNFSLTNNSVANLGVSPSVLSELSARATAFGFTPAENVWTTNHKKNTQTMIDNVPGVEDGVAGNEPVFTDAGSYARSNLEWVAQRKALYFTMNASWKTLNTVTDGEVNHRTELNAYDGKYELVLPEDFSTWYDNIRSTYLRDSDNNGTDDIAYDRIRYGESVIRQNKVFVNNSLHVVELNSASSYTVTDASGFNITLDGDILFDFNYTPAGNETFDVLLAADITTANLAGLFDRIRFDGFAGNYTLEIIAGSPKKLRLTLTSPSTDWYLDVDNDGYYTGNAVSSITSPGIGFRSTGLLGGNDCDDSDASITTGCSSPVNIYYVATSGSDTNNGLSTSVPFKTITYASTIASHGDKILVLAGTYSNASYPTIDIWSNESTISIINKQTTSDKYLIVRPLVPNSVTLNGNGTNILLIRNSNYIKIEGFNIVGEVDNIDPADALYYQFTYKDANGNILERVPRGSTDAEIAAMTLPILSNITRPTYYNTAGIMIGNSHHIDVLSNVVSKMPGEGIRAFDSDFLNIIGNEVSECTSSSPTGVHGLSVYTANSAIDATNSSYTGVRILIAKNKVHDNVNGMYSWSSTKNHIEPKIDEGKGITVQRCTPAYGWNNGKIRIENNIAYQNGFSGIQVNSGSRIEIVNNTVYKNYITSLLFGADGNQHGISIQDANEILIKNNIIHAYPRVGNGNALNVSLNSGTSGFVTITKNLIWGSANTTAESFQSDFYDFPTRFLDSTNADFSLASNSLAIDAGDASGAPTDDFNGVARSTTPDLGALEFSAASIYTWTGTTNTSWSTASNWSPATVPEAGSIIVIATSSNPPVFTGTTSYSQLTVNSSAAISLAASSTLGVLGNVVNNGTISGDGTLEFNGSSAQQISGTGIVQDIKINNTSGGVSIASGNNKMYVTGVYTPTTGVLTTNGNLVFRSTASQEGVVGTAGTCPTEPISGEVTVEKYIPAKRAFRFLTPGVTTSTNINANWQEGSSVSSTAGYPYTSGTENPNVGYGTHITGAGSATNGFDVTLANSPSLFTFDVGAYNWVAESNTNGSGNVLKRGEAYRIFIRGSRNANLNSDTESPGITTLRTTGTLKVCESMTFTTTSPIVPLSSIAGRFSFIGNPFWSVVDWHAVDKVNVESNLYYWDPTVSGTNGRGAYVTYSQSTSASSLVGSNLDRYIQPGQAFFVRNNPDVGVSTIPSVTFDAADVVGTSVSRTAIFARSKIIAGNEFGENQQSNLVNEPSSTVQKIYVSLFINGKEETGPADGFLLAFGQAFSRNYGKEDALKFTNLDENIAANFGERKHAILGLPSTTSNTEQVDSVPISMSNLYPGEYVLQITPDQKINREIYLLNKKTGEFKKLDSIIGYKWTFQNPNGNKLNDDFVLITKLNKIKEVPKIGKRKLHVYPNPVTGDAIDLLVSDSYFKTEEIQKGATLIISSIDGVKLVKKKILVNKNEPSKISLSGLSKGVFIVKLIIDNQMQTTKIIKQ